MPRQRRRRELWQHNSSIATREQHKQNEKTSYTAFSSPSNTSFAPNTAGFGLLDATASNSVALGDAGSVLEPQPLSSMCLARGKGKRDQRNTSLVNNEVGEKEALLQHGVPV